MRLAIREAFIQKNLKNYGKFHNWSDPPLPTFLVTIMENFEKYLLFYSLKKWSSIELKCIFLNYGI